MQRLFSIISFIFHPIWIPTWILILWFEIFLSHRFDYFSSTFGLFLGYELFLLVLIPGLIATSSKLGKGTDWQMKTTQSRIWPFLIGGIFWIGYTINVGKELGNAGEIIWKLTGSGGILLLILSFCYYKEYKLSAHASGWALLLPLFILDHTLPENLRLAFFVFSILVTGFVSGIRWISGAHQGEELVGGIILGLLSSSFFLLFVS